MHSRISDRPFCQIPGCRRHSATVVEVDLPAAWEASRGFTTLTIHAGLCHRHGPEAARRVQAMLEARAEFHDLLSIIEQAVRYEKGLQLRLEVATDEADRYELEASGLRQELHDTQAELRLARNDQLGHSTLRWAGQWWVPVAGGGA